MPIFRAQDAVCYFSHIPKCGGTSVEEFIETVSGRELGMLDRRFYGQGTASPWSASSPQHIPGDVLSRYFPITFFDNFFAVTRHPVQRFVSAFFFQKYLVGSIPQTVGINDFVARLEELDILAPGRFDNHFLPQVHFLYPEAPYSLFKLEDGLDRVKDYIGSLFGIEAQSVVMPHAFKRGESADVPKDELTAESIRIIEKLYAIDFSTFDF